MSDIKSRLGIGGKWIWLYKATGRILEVMENVQYLHCINVNILVVILSYSFARCYRLAKTTWDLFVLLCNSMWIYNFLKIKFLMLKKVHQKLRTEVKKKNFGVFKKVVHYKSWHSWRDPNWTQTLTKLPAETGQNF